MRTEEAQNDQDLLPAPEQPPNRYSFSGEHRGNAKLGVNRFYTVSPREGERYHNGLLLHQLKRAVSSKIYELSMERSVQISKKRAGKEGY